MLETGKLIDNFAEIDFTFLYWIFGAVVALILLIVVAHVLRGLFASRVRQVQEFGMDFDAVATMLDKGLLSTDEAKRVKSVLTRHFSRLYERRFSGKSAGDPMALAESEAIASGNPPLSSRQASGRPPAVRAQHAAPASPTSKPSKAPISYTQEVAPEAPPDEPIADLPLDVLDMYRAGMITDDELAALRRFYAARARASK
jgi:hypothetical protein